MSFRILFHWVFKHSSITESVLIKVKALQVTTHFAYIQLHYYTAFCCCFFFSFFSVPDYMQITFSGHVIGSIFVCECILFMKRMSVMSGGQIVAYQT